MPHLTLARIDYNAAYRALRITQTNTGNSKSDTTKSIIAGDLIWKAYGKMGHQAIMSFNARQATEWKLMRHHNRLQSAMKRKAGDLLIAAYWRNHSPFRQATQVQE